MPKVQPQTERPRPLQPLVPAHIFCPRCKEPINRDEHMYFPLEMLFCATCKGGNLKFVEEEY